MEHNKRTNTSSKSHKSCEGQSNRVLIKKLNQLKKEVLAERKLLIKEKLERTREDIEAGLSGLNINSAPVNDKSFIDDNGSYGNNKLLQKMAKPIYTFDPLRDSGKVSVVSDVISSETSTNLPFVEKPEIAPPCSTWMFRRNKKEKMNADRSIGRRWIRMAELETSRILEEVKRESLEKEKHKFVECEDRILRMVIDEFELTEDVLIILTEYVQGTISEIEERCNYLMEKNQATHQQESNVPEKFGSDGAIPFEKRLDEATKSFDCLFCRTCFMFDCRVHGAGEDVPYPAKKKPYKPDPESDDGKKPCSKHCYLVLGAAKHPVEGHSMDPIHSEALRKQKASRLNVSKGAEASPIKKRKATAGDEVFPVKKREHVVEYEAKAPNEVTGHPGGSEWRPLEKDLLEKGIEIFGRNSCLIRRNMLSGMKTCAEVFNYMNAEKTSKSGGSNIEPPDSCPDEHEQANDVRNNDVNQRLVVDPANNDVNRGVVVNPGLRAMLMSLTIISAAVWRFCS